MAKSIYLSNNDIEEICKEVRESLGNTKIYSDIKIKRPVKTDDRIAVVYFTPTAWIKITSLVGKFDSEVQWHGLVSRVSESEFMIYDIIVPPHEVTGVTVTSEYKSYTEWLDGLDDKTFNDLRFHGHSHVNMSVFPSSVDNKYRTDLVTQMPKPTDDEDTFYIFMIINKDHKCNFEIYDFTNNALYGNNEIFFECYLDGGEEINSFIKEAKKVAVERTFLSSTSQKGDTKKDADKSCTKNNEDKKSKTGKYFGYDSWEEYCDAVYGIDDDEDPTSPFYAKDWGRS